MFCRLGPAVINDYSVRTPYLDFVCRFVISRGIEESLTIGLQENSKGRLGPSRKGTIDCFKQSMGIVLRGTAANLERWHSRPIRRILAYPLDKKTQRRSIALLLQQTHQMRPEN